MEFLKAQIILLGLADLPGPKIRKVVIGLQSHVREKEPESGGQIKITLLLKVTVLEWFIQYQIIWLLLVTEN